jgi:hypothetical protein
MNGISGCYDRFVGKLTHYEKRFEANPWRKASGHECTVPAFAPDPSRRDSSVRDRVRKANQVASRKPRVTPAVD